MIRSFLRTAGPLLACLCLAALPLAALAQDVLPGKDLFQSDPTNTGFCFCDHPIPADFFGPGSDPFDQPVNFTGSPLPPDPSCPFDDLSSIDTVLERLGVAELPAIGSSDTVPIEIVALSLVSVAPIVVTYNGGQDPELWNIQMELTPSQPTTGQMLIEKTHASGGLLDIDLIYSPSINFLQGPLSLHWSPAVPLSLTGTDIPWSYESPPANSCRSNICINPGGLTVVGGPEEGAGFGWLAYCPTGPVATDKVNWGEVKSLYR